MRLRQEQLDGHLQTQLAPVYFVSSDEPLQSMVAVDAIRKAANNKGYIERDILNVEGQFDWGLLQSASEMLSLFSEKKIVDLRLPSGKPGQQGSKAIQAYLKKIPDDKILIIQSGKIDYRARNAAWVKAIDAAGVVIQIWDLSPAQTLAWVAKRVRQTGLQPSQDAIRLLTERVEGNLLAAAQEIQKLHSLFGEGVVSDQQVLESVTDSSRFSIFDLSDAIMVADKKRIQHILKILREEGTAVTLVLWAITDLARKLYQANYCIKSGKGNSAIVNKVPRPKQSAFNSACRRLLDTEWQGVWDKLVEIDWKSKGVGAEPSKGELRIWDEFLDVTLLLAGR